MYTTDMSILDARELAARLGAHYDEISVTPILAACHTSLLPALQNMGSNPDNTGSGNNNGAQDTTDENLQSRIRGILLMALSNRYGALVLTTGNKSELAVGYCTLYGDMAGGFSVIKDLSKGWVYRLCRYRNTSRFFGRQSVIPARILLRAPSAELREDQTDEDHLPPYPVLDAIMQQYVEQNQTAEKIMEIGYAAEDVDKVIALMKRYEYKRRQAPIGTCVTPRSFGRDWRYPVTVCCYKP